MLHNAITGTRCLKSDRIYVGIDADPHVDSPHIPVMASPGSEEPALDDNDEEFKPVHLKVTMKDGAFHEIKLTKAEDIKKFALEGEDRVWLGGKLKWVKEEDIEKVSGRKVDDDEEEEEEEEEVEEVDEVVKRLVLDDESCSSSEEDGPEWTCSICGRTDVPFDERRRLMRCCRCQDQ